MTGPPIDTVVEPLLPPPERLRNSAIVLVHGAWVGEWAVTLVGHSYGGRVITLVVDRLEDRIAALVYLDAHTPVADDPGQPASRIEAAERNGGMLPFPEEYRPDPELLGGERAVAWFDERLMPQSFACFTAPWLSPPGRA